MNEQSSIIHPNKMAISAFLHGLFHPTLVHPYPDALIEVASGPPERGPCWGRVFPAFDLGPVADFCQAQSLRGYNVYVAPCLVRGTPAGRNGRCTEANFFTAFHGWADADAGVEAVLGILRERRLVPVMALSTASIPQPRMQFYFRLDGPVDADTLRGVNKALSVLLSTDEVSAPTHLMRVNGTVNYPSPSKAAKGRVPEVVAFHLPVMPTGNANPVYAAAAICKMVPTPDDGSASGPANGERDPYSAFSGEGWGRQGRDDEALYALLEGAEVAGQWHNSMRDAIATMVGRGWTEGAIRFACAGYCRDGYADKDLDPLIAGAFRKWGAPPDERTDERTDGASGYRRPGQDGQNTQDSGKDAGKTPADLYELHWHDANAEVTNTPWLVKDLLPETGTGLLAGQWGTGKSFVALDLAGSVATGLPFAGHEVTARGGVLYVAAEGASAMAQRLKALVDGKLREKAFLAQADGNPLPEAIDFDKLPISWIAACPYVQNRSDYKRLMDTLKAAVKAMLERFGVPIRVIIIDTMAQVGHFKDANDAAEAQRVMALLAELGREIGALVLIVDHFGKDVSTGTRNSSAKEDYADVVLAFAGDRELMGSTSNTVMGVRKLRTGSAGTEFSYELKLVTLDNGDTSRVIEWKERRVSEPIGGKGKGGRVYSKPARDFKRALDNVMATYGRQMRPFAPEPGPEVRAVQAILVRDEFFKSYDDAGDEAAGKGTKGGTKRAAFKRAKDAACKEGMLSFREIGGVGYYWYTAEPKT